MAMPNRAIIASTWTWECYTKEGDIKWKRITRNQVTKEGLDALLNIMFHGSTQITTWYIGLIESDDAPSENDTYASPGATECTAYEESNRVTFHASASVDQAISNTSNKASFTMNAAKTIYGAMLVGGGTAAATKKDTAGGGTLYCRSTFDSQESVEEDEILKVTVTLSAVG